MANKKREFARSFLQETIMGDTDAEVIEDEIVDHSRWSVHHYLVFRFENKYYGLPYQRGATEMQDESPLENEPEWIKINEIEPIEVVKREWRLIPDDTVRPERAAATEVVSKVAQDETSQGETDGDDA